MRSVLSIPLHVIILIVLMALPLSGCGTVVVDFIIEHIRPMSPGCPDVGPNPPDCCEPVPETCIGVTFKGTFQLSRSIPKHDESPLMPMSSERILGAVVVGKNENVEQPAVSFDGIFYRTDSDLSAAQTQVLTEEMRTQGLYDPATQAISLFRTTLPVPLKEGSGTIDIPIEGFAGHIVVAGTTESDVDDGLPLDHLNINSQSQFEMPLSNAGGPYLVECDGAETSVKLDGTQSTASPGGTLSYVWGSDCPGVRFDDRTSATPMLILDTSCGCNFSCQVQLVVFQEGLSAASYADIQVVDRTPPDIQCPSNVTVECVTPCGTPATDTQLIDFFRSVKSVDRCSGPEDVVNDSPDCFELGHTTVTFRSNDAQGNTASCLSDVLVEDTTPPEISVRLDQDVLWPPNHQMREIHSKVTVLDTCDPNPQFWLEAISSDEPVSARGPGKSMPDVSGAEFGSPDTVFSVRAERDGRKDGRTYTIVYVASDISGNRTEVSVLVRVPHDLRNGALTASEAPNSTEPSERNLRIIGYPSPARSGNAKLGYYIPEGVAGDEVTIDVFDVTGRRVRSLGIVDAGAGNHQMNWDLRDGRGKELQSGMYFYLLSTKTFRIVNRLLVIR